MDEKTSKETLVDDIMSIVEGSDGGDSLSDEKKVHVDDIISKLILLDTTSTPLTDPTLVGNYEVVYTSTRNASQQGAPAGGRFRSGLGKALFKTTGLYQSILEGGIAVNKVSFLVLGILRGHVALRGAVKPQTNGRTCDVFFDPPVISILDSLVIRIGPRSSVTLTTPYLSDRIRLGVGSRGSMFVFARNQKANEADMDMAGLERSTYAGLASFFGFLSALALTSCGLWVLGTTQPIFRVLAGLPALLGLGFASILFKGGIVQGDDKIVAPSASS